MVKNALQQIQSEHNKNHYNQWKLKNNISKYYFPLKRLFTLLFSIFTLKIENFIM